MVEAIATQSQLEFTQRRGAWWMPIRAPVGNCPSSSTVKLSNSLHSTVEHCCSTSEMYHVSCLPDKYSCWACVQSMLYLHGLIPEDALKSIYLHVLVVQL
jgi:hypothetical protein